MTFLPTLISFIYSIAFPLKMYYINIIIQQTLKCIMLKSESIINDKKDGLAPKNLKTKQLKNYLERLKSKKQRK